jgi:hypothetical protein
MIKWYQGCFVWHSITNKIETVSIESESMRPAESLSLPFLGQKLYCVYLNGQQYFHYEKGTSNNNVFLRDLQTGTTTMISVDP